MMSDPLILNNRYHLQGQLGSGGMAMVYRARDLMLERPVAVKVLREDFSRDPNFRSRFRDEAKAVANLSHPNIVTIHDFGLHENRLFIVMEYVPGTDLQEILKRRGRLIISEAVSIILQACAGIGYAHESGLVHCDIKPQNLLVNPSGQVKVLDFGIARALATISPDERTDVVWGSPKYFSPEQARGEPPSPASDVYSLGVVLYEMLTGELPFSADSPDALARLHREAPPPSPRKYNPRVPSNLELITLNALAKSPAARYPNAKHMGQVLKEYQSQVDSAIQAGTAETQQYPKSPNILANQSVPIQGRSRASTFTDERHSPRAVKTKAPAQTNTRMVGFDWVTWLLALLALLLVGGLIPFWIWVYYMINPPLG